MPIPEFYETMRRRAEALRRHRSLEPAPEYEFEPEVIEPKKAPPLKRVRPPFPESKDYRRLALRPAQDPTYEEGA